MSRENESHFSQAHRCQICNKLNSKTDIRIRDHCHVTDKQRGTFQICSANYSLTKKLSIIAIVQQDMTVIILDKKLKSLIKR